MSRNLALTDCQRGGILSGSVVQIDQNQTGIVNGMTQFDLLASFALDNAVMSVGVFNYTGDGNTKCTLG